VWPSIDHPDDVVIIVRWESLAQWKSFPDELNVALDAKMQDVQVAITSEALAIYGG
jgi:heme-degrading monooxygenase HmoA